MQVKKHSPDLFMHQPAPKKPAEAVGLAPTVKPGRVFTISLKGIPRVDAKAKARLQAAARSPDSKRQEYPRLVVS